MKYWIQFENLTPVLVGHYQNANEAVLEEAARVFSDLDYPDEFNVAVREKGSPVVKLFTICVEPQPLFTASPTRDGFGFEHELDI